jgi:hypothetical protein
MHNFPQELVDHVIDKLHELFYPSKPITPDKISNYSRVSWKWVERTQRYHFECLRFKCQEDVEKWKAAIEPDRSGVSQHVCTLKWSGINALRGFESHLNALTNVKAAEFSRCGIFASLDSVRILYRLASR